MKILIGLLEQQEMVGKINKLKIMISFMKLINMVNERYPHFKQSHFTAGDQEQFFKYRNKVECLGNKLGVNTGSVTDTFNYIFIYLKKGLFIQYMNKKLTFLPFSNNHYRNNFHKYIKIHPEYGTIDNFIKYMQTLENRKFYRKSVNHDISRWYGNNGLMRYEYPVPEGDSGMNSLYEMFSAISVSYFCEFFVNKRDFPILRKDRNHPYTRMYGLKKIEENYNFSPILSMVSHNDYDDIAIPNWYDWEQAKKTINYITWGKKQNKVIFRGASTGNALNNLRINACLLNFPWLDAGITKWNARPRLNINKSLYLETINKHGLKLANFMTPMEQSQYKYILNIPGHVCAYRLSLELNMNSVIFLVDCEYKLWFQKFLIATDISKGIIGHYIPINRDYSNLEDVWLWCESNQDKCLQIIKNAKKFYNKYLTRSGILSCLKNIILHYCKCDYVYPANPFTKQLIKQEKFIRNIFYPKGDICPLDNIPRRNYRIVSWCLNGNFPSDLKLVKKNIYTFNFQNVILCCKKVENVHEAFIGLKYINYIAEIIPNFMYTFGINNNIMYSEYIHGETMLDFILSDKYNVCEYISILLQISLALDMVKDIKFVHYDLFPWNIVLQRKNTIVNYKTIVVKTDIVPVIIDYGRSQCGKFGYAAPPLETLEYSHFQDILSLVLSTLSSILHVKYKSTKWYQIGNDKDIYINLLDIILDDRLNTISEIKRYCKYEKNLSLLLLREKKITELTPIQFFYKISTFPNTITWKHEKQKLDLRRNSLSIYKDLCEENYDICKEFLKKTLPMRSKEDNIYIYKSCIATLSEHKNNKLYKKCLTKLNKKYKKYLVNENEYEL